MRALDCPCRLIALLFVLAVVLAACAARPRDGDDGMDGSAVAAGLRYELHKSNR